MRNVSLLSLLLFVSLACSDDAVRKLDESVRGKVKKQDKIKDVKLTFQPMVDILFVIDNSGSMGNHQANLARNVVSFTSSIVNNVLLDYHIGVVTSDMTTHAGELQGNPLWVERNTPNAKQVLANNLQPGTSGDYLEKFFEPLIAALYPPLVDSVNKGFYRQEAFLAIVFITDAAIRGPLTAKATFDMLLQLKNSDREKLAAYAALIPPDNPNRCQYDDQWNQDNLNVFIDFLSFFDGAGWGRTYFDLCSPNFGDELANIGKDLENKIEMFIPLKEFPVIETIQIKYGEQVIPQDAFFGWSYVENRVGILLGKGLKLKEQKDAELTINYIPAKVN